MKEKIKIIFLDFDGVLNSQDWYDRRDKQFPDEPILNECFHDEWGEVFDPIAVENLKILIEKTNAKIVVSASGRHGSGPNCVKYLNEDEPNKVKKLVGLNYIKTMWKSRKLPGKVIDITPYFFMEKGKNLQLDSKTVKISSQHSVPRGVEIKSWLNANGFCHFVFNEEDLKNQLENCPIENYVIIDDDSDMLYEQYDRFVQTSAHEDGFNTDCLNKAIQILNTPIKFKNY